MGEWWIREPPLGEVGFVSWPRLGERAVAIKVGTDEIKRPGLVAPGIQGFRGGRMIVIVAGLVIIGVGVAAIVKGVKKSFAEEIDTSPLSPTLRTATARLGQVGYIAKDLALGVIGGLLSYATLTFDPQKAQGLDGAMQTILAQPFGRFCSPPWRWDSPHSACSPYSSPDTAECKCHPDRAAHGPPQPTVAT
jgi:Domain of Unknown Function (DUF1206)